MQGLLPKLVGRYGWARVVDVFKDTGMEHHAQKLGFGSYVVRDVLPTDACDQFHTALEITLNNLALQTSVRSVQCKGKKQWHNTIQCTGGACACKYEYEGTARNPVYRIHDTEPCNELSEWLHADLAVPRQDYFDECVTNIYSRPSDQCIPPHTDQNPMLGPTADIVSLTLGAAGVFFWRPARNGVFGETGGT